MDTGQALRHQTRAKGSKGKGKLEWAGCESQISVTHVYVRTVPYVQPIQEMIRHDERVDH